MKFASAATTQRDTRLGGTNLVSEVRQQLGGDIEPDFVMFFATREHIRYIDRLAADLRRVWPDALLLGSTAQDVFHASCPRATHPAITLLACSMPGVTLAPVQLDRKDFEQQPLGLEKWEEMLQAITDPQLILLLGDPFTAPVPEMLETIDMVAPHVPVAGGMASGARRTGSNILVLNDELHRSGVVAIGFGGDLSAEVIVSQGYAPIGQPFRVTKAEGNVLLELNGQPALEALQEMVATLPSDKRNLLRGGLMVGEALAEKSSSGRGDFLVRAVVGVDQEDGAIALAGLVDEGRTVRFQVWDNTLADDLEMLLLPQISSRPASGGLLFASWPNEGPLPRPGLDISQLHKWLGYDLPLAGMFSSGEVGPIHDANYVHTHSATLALFRPREKSVSE